jgi:hypothetical protein
VRSITSNYIGSYKGIFKNGVKLKFPEYTDGFIREIGNEAFICYEGLYRDSAGKISVYANAKKELLINGLVLGFARDIQFVEDGYYVLTSTKGVYLVNFGLKILQKITSEEQIDNCSILTIDHSDKNSTRIFYTAQSKIYIYAVQTKETILLLDSKYPLPIKQAFFPNTIDKIYVLFDDKLSLFTLNDKVYSETVLMDKMSFCHNFVFLKEKIYVTSNIGFNYYDLKKNKPYYNVIPVEINNRSLSVINDTIKFGTINGIINLSENNIEKITEEYEDSLLAKSNSNSSFESNYKLFLGIILLLIIIVIVLIYYLIKNKNKPADKVIEKENYGEATKDNIIYYIQDNITTVTIQSIRDAFDLTPIALYEILGNDKPGELIRNHRMELVRKYRRIKLSEEDIAQKTGFSVSYLKKIF